jgi:selenocysteine lyase/cysteine desulfurase
VITPPFDVDGWRARIPLLARAIPMNNCSQAPQTDRTRAAAERYLESWNSRGMDWDAWVEEVALAKRAFASLINASPDEIAVFSSVSEATSAVASAIDFRTAKSRVVVSDAEFPTVSQIWLAQQSRGAEVEWVSLTDGESNLADYDRAIDERTAIVSAAHAYYLNGGVQDVSAIARKAHAHGALIFVDAYQTAGAIPVDVRAMDVDFLASGNLKFLMGIPGIAFLYVRRALIDSLRPTITGWFGRENPFAFDARRLDWSPTAARLETGTPPVLNAYVARAGMEIIAEIGVDRIRSWHMELTTRLIGGGRDRGLTLHGTADVAGKTASTAFVVGDAHAVEVAMRARGVIPSARGPVIRLAPHFYTTLDDVDTALDALAGVTLRA